MSEFLTGLHSMLNHAKQYLPEVVATIECLQNSIEKATAKHKALKGDTE